MFYAGVLVLIIGVYMAYKDAMMMADHGNFGETLEPTFEWRYFFNMLIFPTILSMVLIGLSEIIKLLDSLSRKMNIQQVASTELKKSFNQAEPSSNTETHEKHEQWILEAKDEEKIYDLYADKAILEIIPSDFKGYCIVKVQDMNGPLNPSVKVVDIVGLAAKEIHDPVKMKEILASYSA